MQVYISRIQLSLKVSTNSRNINMFRFLGLGAVAIVTLLLFPQNSHIKYI